MQVNNIQNNAVYGVKPRPEAEDRQDERIPEEKEFSRKRDEYVPSEEDEDIGLYTPAEDKKASPDKDGKEEDETAEKSEVTTCNTDRVDGEIKRLKEKREQLEQKLRSADGENAERIRKQLESVSAELALKDNDTYRRQNADFA